MKEVYKKCPCGTVSGFYLENNPNKEEEYFCSSCGNETKLKDWKDSTRREYVDQIEAIDEYGGSLIG